MLSTALPGLRYRESNKNIWIMREETDEAANQQVISVWVRDPRIQKNDFWHAYIDYEICLHTNSVSFTKKISIVRRRYSEFVWLRQKLQANSQLMLQLPELPPKNLFFSMNNAQQITERMKGLQTFLEQTIQSPPLLSDSCLHLFLQSQLSTSKMEACAVGRTHYSVAQAVQRCGLRRFHSEEDLKKDLSMSCDSDSDSSECPKLRVKDLAMKKAASTALLGLMGTSQEGTLSCSCDST
ncbi:sorting nexin-10B [Cottoperca gobio]|uniref:Sorting nexin-10B n=1 Tax=Cottoperca gobio TaxID=56716 RepID=A0A6J2RD19_COTGO|nr:sorting nexin-10 [Cottoperca gobio]